MCDSSLLTTQSFCRYQARCLYSRIHVLWHCKWAYGQLRDRHSKLK